MAMVPPFFESSRTFTKAFQLPMKVIKDTDAKQHVDIYSILPGQIIATSTTSPQVV